MKASFLHGGGFLLHGARRTRGQFSALRGIVRVLDVAFFRGEARARAIGGK